MPFPATPIIDDFSRANETPIAAPWVTATNWWSATGANLTGNALVPNGVSGSYLPTAAVTTDWEYYFTTAALPDTLNDYVEFDIILDPTDPNSGAYSLTVSKQATDYFLRLGRWDAGAFTLLGGASVNLVAGDQVGIRRIGTGIGVYWNGALVSAWVVDATYVTGPFTPSFGFDDTGGTPNQWQITAFGGGTLNASGQAGGWVFRAASPVATGSTDLTITKPTGTVDNDIMLMRLSHKGAGFATVPSGWTLIRQGLSGTIRGEAYWKRATSEGANYSVTGLADSACGFIVSYAGGLLSGDVVADSAISLNASGVETCPSVTPTLPNQLIAPMVALAANNVVTFNGPLTAGALTYTERQDGGTTNGTDSRVASADTLSPGTDPTGTIGLSFTNTESVAITVALIAEPSPGPGEVAFRFYPTLIQPNVRIAGQIPGTWNTQAPILNAGGWGTDNCYTAQPTKAYGGTKTDTSLSTNQQGNFDAVLMQWNTPPLAAQSIAGTFDICFMTNVRWVTPSTNTSDSVAVYKVHLAIMVGQTGVVRHVLLDNYVDPNEWQRTFAVGRWQSLASPQSLTAGAALEGDTVRMVLGYRLVSSPTPPPIYPSEPFNVDQNASMLIWRALGTTGTETGPGLPDAPPGNVTSVTFCPWMEFSGGLLLSSTVIPENANATCAAAVVAPTVPFRSDLVDTSGGESYQKPAWYTFTAPRSGVLFIAQFGSTYAVRFLVYTGACGSLTPVNPSVTNTTVSPQRGRTVIKLTVAAGTQYWVEALSTSFSANQARNSGGAFQLVLFYQETPEEDDLYLPCLQTLAFRRYDDGSLFPVNIATSTNSFTPTGIAIDYTRRPMDDFAGGINTNVRILVGLHAVANLVEIFDSLDFHEVDFIAGSTNIDNANLNKHVAQLHIDPAGELTVGFFGNGYLWVEGFNTLPSALNAISDESRFAAPQSLSATAGDSQPGAPFTAVTHNVDQTPIAPWALSRLGDILYYVSAGFYVPVGGQTIKRFNVATAVQGVDLVTLPPSVDPFMPGMKGLEVLPNGTVLATNATYGVWLSATGAVLQTYTPTRPEFFRSITDIKSTADGQRVWVVDGDTTTLALFDLLTGVEIATYDTWLSPGCLVQMAIYQPDGVEPPGGCPGTRGDPPDDGLPYVPPVFPSCAGSGQRGDPPTGA